MSDRLEGLRALVRRPSHGMDYRLLVALLFILLLGISVLILVMLSTRRTPQVGIHDNTMVYSGTRQRFRFIGGNHFNLLVKYVIGDFHGYSGREVFAQASIYNLTAIRFWATCSDGYFADVCVFDGEKSFLKNPQAFFSSFDALVSDAERDGIYLIPVLNAAYGGFDKSAGNGSVCKVGSPSNLLYKEFVASVVERYKDRSVILAWEIGNEGNRECADAGELAAWYTDSASLIRSIDKEHIISTGDNNFGTQDTASFITTQSSPEITAASSHIYDRDLYYLMGVYDRPQEEKQAAIRRYIDYWTSVSRIQLYKPFYIGEFGTYNLSEKSGSDFYPIFLDAAVKSDIDGVMLWSWMEGAECVQPAETFGGACVSPERTPAIASAVGMYAGQLKSVQSSMINQGIAKGFFLVIVPIWLIATVAIRTKLIPDKKGK
jgi:hypothetical protein